MDTFIITTIFTFILLVATKWYYNNRRKTRTIRTQPPQQGAPQQGLTSIIQVKSVKNQIECPICGDEVEIQNIYTINCSKTHQFCINCLRDYSLHKLSDNEKITCPAVGCNYEVELWELQEIGMTSKFVEQYSDLLTAKLLQEIAVPCPTRDCKNCIIPISKQLSERFFCGSCKFTSCTLCKEEFHFRSLCEEVPSIKSSWKHWSERERKKFWDERTIYRRLFDAIFRFIFRFYCSDLPIENSFCSHCKQEIKLISFSCLSCQLYILCEECDRKGRTKIHSSNHCFRIITDLPISSSKLELIELDLSKEIINSTTKACPKCNKRIEKNGGCAHMTCKCGHEFFWCCLRAFRVEEQARAHRKFCK